MVTGILDNYDCDVLNSKLTGWRRAMQRYPTDAV